MLFLHYQILYRSYMRFQDIVGNNKGIAHLRGMVDEGRIPHALLLFGQEGTGKLAMARALAQYIHCENHTPDGDSCGVCPSCRQHAALNHADTIYSFPISQKGTSRSYLELWKQFISENPFESYRSWQSMQDNANAQLQIYVNESEEILHKLNLSAYNSNYKILIMWLPEKMNVACANKLLKMIEEPHDDTLMIFVSDNPKELLPTIISRMQRVEIPRLADNEIAGYLTLNQGIDATDAIAVAHSADGNIVTALEAVKLGGETQQFFEAFVDLMRKAYQRDFVGLKDWTENIADYKREKSRRFLSYGAHLVRENFIYNLNHPELNHLTRTEAGFSTKFARFINDRNVEDMIKEFNLAESDIKGNGNPKIVLFDFTLKISKLIRK